MLRRFLPEHACGGGTHVHHRKLRRAGDHRPVNLVALCTIGHDYVHGHPAWSYDVGLMVRQHDEVRPL